MDLVAFHQGLFGKAPSRTPKAFRVTPQQRRLYKGFPQVRGFSLTAEQSKAWRNQERLLSALVLALAQTEPSEEQDEREVFLFLPQHYEDWVLNQIKEAGRYAIRRRKGNPEGIDLIKVVFQQVSLMSDFSVPEPKHWATYGFCHEGVLPDWIGDRLIKAKR